MELKDIEQALVVGALFRSVINDENKHKLVALVKSFVDSHSSQMFGTIDGIIEDEISLFGLSFGYANYPSGDFVEVMINLYYVSIADGDKTLYESNPLNIGRVCIPRTAFVN